MRLVIGLGDRADRVTGEAVNYVNLYFDDKVQLKETETGHNTKEDASPEEVRK